MPEQSSISHSTSARRTIRMEAAAVASLEERNGAEFNAVCALLLQVRGRIIITDIGKSGHIARQIAATLAST